eukprot:5218999-Amphidinium_carterae.1
MLRRSPSDLVEQTRVDTWGSRKRRHGAASGPCFRSYSSVAYSLMLRMEVDGAFNGSRSSTQRHLS